MIDTKKAIENFKKYLRVQTEGNYNMITEARAAAMDAGLTMEEYKDVIHNYSTYRSLYDSSKKANNEP